MHQFSFVHTRARIQVVASIKCPVLINQPGQTHFYDHASCMLKTMLCLWSADAVTFKVQGWHVLATYFIEIHVHRQISYLVKMQMCSYFYRVMMLLSIICIRQKVYI